MAPNYVILHEFGGHDGLLFNRLVLHRGCQGYRCLTCHRWDIIHNVPTVILLIALLSLALFVESKRVLIVIFIKCEVGFPWWLSPHSVAAMETRGCSGCGGGGKGLRGASGLTGITAVTSEERPLVWKCVKALQASTCDPLLLYHSVKSLLSRVLISDRLILSAGRYFFYVYQYRPIV